MKRVTCPDELVALALAVCAAAATLSLSPPAFAQKKEAAKAPALDMEALRKDLESGDDERVHRALERIRDAGVAAKALAPQIDALLRRGPGAKSCVTALAAAGALEQPALSAPISPYVRHRAPPVRRAAARALLKAGGPDAIRTLRMALRSSDSVVRALAASGLGQLGAKEALADLLTALDRGVPEAAASIGRLCDETTCGALLDRLDKRPFEMLTSGLDEILFRAPAALADDAKIVAINRIAQLGTDEAAAYLAAAAKRWPPGWSKRVKQALDASSKTTVKAPAKGAKP
jgi:HEAT repeat protein